MKKEVIVSYYNNCDEDKRAFSAKAEQIISLTRKIAKTNSSVSMLRYDAIREFVTQIKDSHLG